MPHLHFKRALGGLLFLTLAIVVAGGCGPTAPQPASNMNGGGRGPTDAAAERPRPVSVGAADGGSDRGDPWPPVAPPPGATGGCVPSAVDGGQPERVAGAGGDGGRLNGDGGDLGDAATSSHDGPAPADTRADSGRDAGADGLSGGGRADAGSDGRGAGGISSPGAGGLTGAGGHAGQPGSPGTDAGGNSGAAGGAAGRGDDQALAPRPGELVMVELLINPAGTDTGREWIEIANRAGHAVSLQGLHLSDLGNDAAVDFAAGAAPTLAPGGRAVIIQSADATKNGGVTFAGGVVGGAFGTLVSLNNDTDQMSLCLGACSSGSLIDRVSWDSTLGPGYDGHALMIDEGARRCSATLPFGDAGSFGTPGSANPPCS